MLTEIKIMSDSLHGYFDSDFAPVACLMTGQKAHLKMTEKDMDV
jgi:hypothetical protein